MRSFLDNTFKSISEFLSSMSKKARARLLIMIAVIVLLAVVIVVLLNQKKYLPLIQAQSPAEASEVMATLTNMNIPYKTEGNNVLVPEDRIADLKIMLANDGYYSTEVDYDLLNQASGFSVTDDHRQKLYEMLCASEIRAQLCLSDKIRNAIVAVNMGKTSVFAIQRDTTEATCAVTLTLTSGSVLSASEAQTIAEIIRGSVQGIKYENITIADSKLNHYSVGDGAVDVSTELQQRIMLENLLIQQIKTQGEAFFTPIFGVYNVKIQPHVVLDFDKITEESIMFSPPIPGEMDGIVRSMSELYELQRIAGAAEGPPGTDTNGMGATEYPYGVLGEGEDYKKYLNERNYEIDQTITTIERERGKIKELSIAILINSDAVEGDYSGEVINLASKGFGVDPSNIAVELVPYALHEKTAEEQAAEWEALDQLLRKRKLMETIIIWAVILILGLAFMALVRSIVKSMKEPEEAEAAAAAAAAAALAAGGTVNYLVGGDIDSEADEDDENYDEYDEEGPYGEDEAQEEEIILNAKSAGLEQIEKFIEKDPASVAQLLRNWITDEE